MGLTAAFTPPVYFAAPTTNMNSLMPDAASARRSTYSMM